MAREEKTENGRSKKKAATTAMAKSNGERNIKKGRGEDELEEVPIVPYSSSNSHNNNHEAQSEPSEEEQHEEVEVSEGEEDVVADSLMVEEEVKSSEASKKKKKKKVNEDTNQKKKSKGKGKETEEEELSSLYRIPMHRVSRIIKSEDPNLRISQEAVFIINKASEKFLHLFATEAYANAFLDRKKFIGYKHLSSVVSKRRKFDFLSDFVPEKVKAEDALKESPSVENGNVL